MVKLSKLAAVLTAIRAIARRLQLSRKTVRRLLGRAPERQPPSSEPRASLLDTYDAEIRRLLADTPEFTAPGILERLRPLGYTGGITILRDRVRRLRPRPAKEAFLTLDFKPGAAFQVDWADFGFALPGCPRRVSGFVMVACYSRYLYLEFTLEIVPLVVDLWRRRRLRDRSNTTSGCVATVAGVATERGSVGVGAA